MPPRRVLRLPQSQSAQIRSAQRPGDLRWSEVQEMSEISRVTRSKAQARGTYDAMSKWYDALAGGSEERFRRLGLQSLDTQPGETILEIGFGTGHAILDLAGSVGASGKVYGIDISPGMHDLALDRVKEAGFSGWVELKCGDAADLPFEADTFDAVFICFTLELFDTPEIPTVLEECRRVLRPKGRLCTVVLSTSEGTSLTLSLYGWAHRAFTQYTDCRPDPGTAIPGNLGFRDQEDDERADVGIASFDHHERQGLMKLRDLHKPGENAPFCLPRDRLVYYLLVSVCRSGFTVFTSDGFSETNSSFWSIQDATVGGRAERFSKWSSMTGPRTPSLWSQDGAIVPTGIRTSRRSPMWSLGAVAKAC